MIKYFSSVHLEPLFKIIQKNIFKMLIDVVEESVSDVKSDITSKSVEDNDSSCCYEIPSKINSTIHNNNVQIFDVRCGLLAGKLHMQLFICPGIHRHCIEFEGNFFLRLLIKNFRKINYSTGIYNSSRKR